MGTCLVFGRHPDTRERLVRHLAEAFDDLDEAASADELLTRVAGPRPDVVVIGVEVDDTDRAWADTVEQVQRADSSVPVVVVGPCSPPGGPDAPGPAGAHEGATLAALALARGARGFLRAEDLADPTGLPGARRRTTELSPRELDVLLGMTEGLSNAEIAAELVLAEDTVKTHARRLFRKLGAGDRADAVARGFRQGFLQ